MSIDGAVAVGGIKRIMNAKSPTKSLSDEEDNDLFYFESDHLALKGNKDYSEVLKTIFVLESQRARAVKDYDTVVELHKEALNDPVSFINKLKNGESLGVPELQIIAEVPSVHWSKYKVPLPEEGLKFVNKSSHKTNTLNFTEEENILRDSGDTHNKPWTTEEQRRLEELLIIYPPEAIEFRRFKKIAAALGNRTVKQVSSRVQKYFLKLYKAGLPIPGRIPKYAERTKKSKLHLHQRHNHYLFKPTTFFPELDIPVTMNESEEVPGPSKNSHTGFTNYLTPDPAHPDVEHRLHEEPRSDLDVQLEILKRVKQEKQNESSTQLMFRHYGYKCDYCSEEPIVGTRWHCLSCAAESVDFCSDCVVSQMYSGSTHPISHRLELIQGDDVAARRGGATYSDSSSESISGSAFDSSNKNVESSDSSISGSDDDHYDETQNSIDMYENVALKYEQEADEDEEDEDTNGFHGYNREIKADTTFEGGNLNEVNCNIGFIKQEVFILKQEGDLEQVVGEEANEEYHLNDSRVMEHDSGVLGSNCSSLEENVNVMQCDDQFSPESFTDTQNVSYGYLHSNLLLDSNT